MEEGFPRLCLKNVERNECFMWPHWTGCQKAVAGHSEKTGGQKAWATAQVLPLPNWEALDK